MGKIQENDARLQQLVSMARIGWWEVDFDEGVYYCSEFVADLLGIEGNKISEMCIRDRDIYKDVDVEAAGK